MTFNWPQLLSDQLDWYWTNLFRPRLTGLTDDEYFWEPVPHCWSVRPDPDGRFRLDFAYPEPSPPPVTTIAWRVCHIGGQILRHPRDPHQFGGPQPELGTFDWPHTAAAGVGFMEESYTRWIAGVRSLSVEAMERPLGQGGGPYAESPFASLVLHINREVFHHAAEVALLRDLYRAKFG
jgi:hypothetical protein